MYVQPCCINKDIPELLKENRLAFFQSNGDWMCSDLLGAVTWMVPEGVLVLSAPSVDVFFLRILARYLGNNWCKAVLLATGESHTEDVKQILGEWLHRVQYVCNERFQDGLLALANGKNYLNIQGPMLMENDFTLCQYAGCYSVNNRFFYQSTEAVLSALKTSAFIRAEVQEVQALLKKDF